MRKLFILMAVACCLTACEKVSVGDDDVDGKSKRSVQFVVKGLDVEYSGSRATLASESMTDLYVWEGSTLLAHQTSSDEDFGSPTISLSVGAHDLTFVASKADGQSWAVGAGSDGNEQGCWTCSKVKDTYGTVLTYTVSSGSTSKQVQLTRCNGKVMWTIEDAVPTTAATANISVSQCMGLDASLNGVEPTTYTSSISLASVVGKAGVTVSTMVLPVSHADGAECTATINILNGSNSSLATYTNTVTVKANEICNIHGSFFASANQALASLVTDWSTTTDYDL